MSFDDTLYEYGHVSENDLNEASHSWEHEETQERRCRR